MTADLVHVEDQHHAVTLFGTDNPSDVVTRASEAAKALASVLEERKLYVAMPGDRRHVTVEGWTLLGTMLGVYPVTEWSRKLVEHDEHVGWEARVIAVTRDGATVGAAEAECRFSERNWRNRESYAVRSMAQTRAASKALRLPLGFVVTLAGYQATPAEEISDEEPEASKFKCPSCNRPVYDQRVTATEKQPKWKCSNPECQGGAPRNKDKPDGKRWPWASWDDWPWPKGHDEPDQPLVEQIISLVQLRLNVDEFDARSNVEQAVEDLELDKDSLTPEQANQVWVHVREVLLPEPVRTDH